MTPRALRPKPVEGAVADEGEADEDEADEQPGVARADQATERRAAAPPSRTSRRTPPAWRTGGRSGRIDRRRTRTDLGSGSNQRGGRFRRRLARACAVAGSARAGRAAAAAAMAARGTCLHRRPSAARRRRRKPLQEADRAAARRRSTVREKVSFLTERPAGSRHRPSATASRSRRQPPRPAATRAEPQPARPRRARPAGGRGASAAANKHDAISQTKNRPAKPGGFFIAIRDSTRQSVGDRGLHIRSDRSAC